MELPRGRGAHGESPPPYCELQGEKREREVGDAFVCLCPQLELGPGFLAVWTQESSGIRDLQRDTLHPPSLHC